MQSPWLNFQEASNLGRSMALEILKKIAVYQPERTLELVEHAILNPTTESGIPEGFPLYGDTHNDILRQLPSLLRQISYTLEFLPRCCDLLWELGRDDDRNLHSNPDHGVRVLADLGGYEIGKPFIVTSRVLDTIEKLLEDPGSHDHIPGRLHLNWVRTSKCSRILFQVGVRHREMYERWHVDGEFNLSRRLRA